MNQEERAKRENAMIAAILDTQKLIQRCQEMEKELQRRKHECCALEETISNLKQENERNSELAAIGEDESQRYKSEILSRLRAIIHHTGNRHRLSAMEQLLTSGDISIAEIKRLHNVVNDEFDSLYPTHPISELSPASIQQEQMNHDWSAFRIP